MKQGPVGTHCVLELYGCSPDVLDDETFVRDAVEQAAKQGVSALLNLMSHRFYPQGVTAIGLLAESHLSIHTWPEHGYAAVDIFTCGETARPVQACTYMVKHFGALRHSLKVLARGNAVMTPDARSAGTEEVDVCRARS